MELVKVSGKIKKIIASNDKVAVYNVELCTELNGKKSYAWITLKDFNPCKVFEEGEDINVLAYLNTSSYVKDGTKCYNLDFIKA